MKREAITTMAGTSIPIPTSAWCSPVENDAPARVVDAHLRAVLPCSGRRWASLLGIAAIGVITTIVVGSRLRDFDAPALVGT